MPSAFTHLVVGSATAQALPGELPRRRLALALGLAAAVPDIDVLAFRLGIPYGDPLGHRGFSHSLLAAALLGGVVALAATWDRRLARRHVWALMGVGFLAVASHGLLDAATDAGRGIGFFIPFSNQRFFWPWRPIATASVNPARFFSARGMEVLWSEIRWVWLPVAAVSIVGLLARWLEARRQPAEETSASLGADGEWAREDGPDLAPALRSGDYQPESRRGGSEALESPPESPDEEGFLLPWVPVGDGRSLENELACEAVRGHPLFGERVRAVARRIDCDDVLFEVIEPGRVGCAVVHLTWKEENDPRWPHCVLLRSVESWRATVMIPDHEEYGLE